MIYNQVSNPTHDTDTRVKETAAFLFNFPFSWYARDGTGKEEFTELFVRQYFLNEIAFETVELFRMKLKQLLEREMPKYEQLYQSTLLKYDPFETVNVDMSHESEKTDTRNKEESAEFTEHQNGSSSHTDSGRSTDHTLTYNNEIEDTQHIDYKEGQDTEDRTVAGNSHTTSSNNSTTESQEMSDITRSAETEKTTNTQSIHSDNPQTNFAGHDYASSMERAQGEETGTSSETDHTAGGGSATTNGSTDATETKSETDKTVKVWDDTFEGSGQKKTKGSSDTEVTKDFSSFTGGSSTSDGTSSNQVTSKDTGEESGSGKSHEQGFRGEYPSLLLKYRETFININEMLLNECGSLFLKIYRSGYETEIGGGYYGLFV